MNKQRLFVASCFALVTTATVFAIRGDIEGAQSSAFHLTKEQIGQLWGPAFWGFTLGILVCGVLVDFIGMRRLLAASSIGYIAAIGTLLFAPKPDAPVESIFGHPGTLLLYVAFWIMGISQGIVEGVINPLVATMYNEEKTKKLNYLHAWWPGGLVIGGLAAYTLTKLGFSWQVKLMVLFVPAVAYLIMILGQEFPKTERVSSNVSTGEMFKQAANPLFLLLFICMWMTAATELGPDQWFPSLMKEITGVEGILFLVLTAGEMFILRFFFSGLLHRYSPFGVLTVCAVLSAIGLYWLGSLSAGTAPSTAFMAAAVFGIGKTFFWPTMLGITSERFPKGGALLMNLMGGAGMLSIGIALPIMGKAFDKEGAGAALRLVAILPVILTVVFGGLYLAFRARGGYRALRIEDEGKAKTKAKTETARSGAA